MKIISLEEIKNCFDFKKIILEIEKSFIEYSNNNISSLPISHYQFEDKKADIHIKSGMMKSDNYFFIKIASGFYDNSKYSISNSQGAIVVINANTGVPEIILNDQGYLTDIRTAIAGVICAKYIAPVNINSVGIFGYGIQSFLQAKFLKIQFPQLKNLYLYGRNTFKIEVIKQKFENLGYHVYISDSAYFVAQNCNLLVTTTPTCEPILFDDFILPGTHITAIGADDGIKQELDISVFKKASRIFVDSIEQCVKYGDSSHAVKANVTLRKNMTEIGKLIMTPNLYERNKSDITISDLTGLAAQDIFISKYILETLNK
ncbi:ornithine cyclodeaminase family protein [Silvanigrella sp.]|jgi:ornithine cyclodeaminase|uniref:ornithine cyclodeaminase family protein n=1 Tax=Silvanigrella sp. TaxID=2024976 RepID=UPI0037C778F4